MKSDKTIRAAMGTPISLCLTCAEAWRQVYTIQQQGQHHTVVCEGCRKRLFGAKYIVEKKGRNNL